MVIFLIVALQVAQEREQTQGEANEVQMFPFNPFEYNWQEEYEAFHLQSVSFFLFLSTEPPRDMMCDL